MKLNDTESPCIPIFQIYDSETYDFNEQMRLIAMRYSAENDLLDALASGDEEKTLAAFRKYGELMNDPHQAAVPTSEDSVRDFKNSVLVMNTLFRKAIESNHVHPIYIHESSSYFGALIEKCETEAELIRIIRDMVHVYTRLVRESSLSPYSPAIRKAILYIDMHLASPVSTGIIAEKLHLNANYLSTRFHQETGMSVSDHILKRRVLLASQLLTTTRLSVQEIAVKSGMQDASYFSKQFRRITGRSPLQYRKEHTV